MSIKLLIAATSLGTALRCTAISLLVIVVLELVVLLSLGRLQPREFSPLLANFDLLQPQEMAPQSYFDEVVERSLFSPERKPKTAVAASVSVEKGKISESWLLAGVVKSGEQSYAIFTEKNGQGRLKLEEGMLLDEWKVETVFPDRVDFMRNGEQESLHMLVSVPKKKPKRSKRKPLRSPVRGLTSEAAQNRAKPVIRKPPVKTPANLAE